jgi:hypothetical protein
MTSSNKELISNTRRVTPEKDPRLHSLFRSVMKLLKPKCRIGIRIGEIDSYACALPKTKDSSCTVCISEYALTVLDREELLFILGHEIGHIIMSLPPPVSQAAVYKDREPMFPDLAGYHPAIAKMVTDVYIESFANMFGISVVEDVDIAISVYNKLLYGPFPNKSVERPDDIVSFTDYAELGMQMQILRQLEKSEFFYDVIGKPLFGYGRNLVSEDTFCHSVNKMFKPWLECTADEYGALTECCHASLHILLRQEGGELKTLSEYSYIWDKFSEAEISKYASTEEAYLKIQELSPVLKGISHILKFRLFGDVIVYAAFEIEKDPYVSEEFVRDVGRYFGLASEELSQYLALYQHRYGELRKAS